MSNPTNLYPTDWNANNPTLTNNLVAGLERVLDARLDSNDAECQCKVETVVSIEGDGKLSMEGLQDPFLYGLTDHPGCSTESFMVTHLAQASRGNFNRMTPAHIVIGIFKEVSHHPNVRRSHGTGLTLAAGGSGDSPPTPRGAGSKRRHHAAGGATPDNPTSMSTS